jgi:hypothetical protein
METPRWPTPSDARRLLPATFSTGYSWRDGPAGLRAKLCRGKNTEHHKAHPNEGRAPKPAFFLSNEFVSQKSIHPTTKECVKKSTISGG